MFATGGGMVPSMHSTVCIHCVSCLQVNGFQCVLFAKRQLVVGLLAMDGLQWWVVSPCHGMGWLTMCAYRQGTGSLCPRVRILTVGHRSIYRAISLNVRTTTIMIGHDCPINVSLSIRLIST